MKIYKIYKDSSYINKLIYLRRRKFPRNKTTFNKKKILKDRQLVKNNILMDIVYYSGFTTNIKHAKHIILEGNILVNNNKLLQPNYKLKSGDIITCIDKKILLSYYLRRWNIIKLRKNRVKRWNKSNIRRFKQYKYLIGLNNVYKLSYNTVLFI